jgi:hypothetical protein
MAPGILHKFVQPLCLLYLNRCQEMKYFCVLAVSCCESLSLSCFTEPDMNAVLCRQMIVGFRRTGCGIAL